MNKPMKIENAQINEKVIATLEWLQDCENACINDCVEDITETVIFIINNKQDLQPKEQIKTDNILQRLCTIRKHFLGLKSE